MRRLPLLLCAGACLLLACVDYNDPCSGLVEDDLKDAVAGYLQGRVYLDRNNTRHANNAIGRMSAEAFVEAFPDGDDKPELGLLNGGSLRDEGGVGPNGQCLTRSVLGQDSATATEVTNGDIHQMLLFENAVYAVDLTEKELFEVMEHSVSGLVPDPEVVVSPSGRFLHVSGRKGVPVEVRIDCALPAGERVTQIQIGARSLDPLEETKFVRVAMPEFLLRGGDDYSMLAPLRTDPARNPIQSQEETGIDNDLVTAWMKEAYGTPDTALVSHETDVTSCTLGPETAPGCDPADLDCCRSPLKLLNCARPPPPEE